jgi:hypothetical protein
MGTYYGYAERSLENQVNWAEVGKSISDTIQEEARIREEKKQAIDDATDDIINNLQNSPTGQHRGTAEATLDFSNAAQETTLANKRLLQSGQMSPKDYMRFLNNLNEGTELAFTTAEAFQSEYQTKMDRLKSGKSQLLELFLMSQVEGFGNLENHSLLPDPITGRVMSYETTLDKNGIRQIVEGSGRSVKSLHKLISQQYDKFDLDGAVKNAVGTLGEMTEQTLQKAEQAGDLDVFLSVSSKKADAPEGDKEFARNYKTWESDAVETIKSNEYNLLSIITQNIVSDENGKAYDFTYDPEKAGGNMILLKQDPSGVREVIPDFSKNEGLEKRVDDYIKNQIRSSIDVKVERKTGGRKSYDPDYAARQRYLREDETQKDQPDVVSNVAKLYYGTEAEVEEAENFLRAINPNIRSISRSNKGVVINFRPDEDGITKTETLDFDVPIAEWVRGNANFFLTADAQIKDVGSVLEKSGAKGRTDTKPSNIVRTIISQAKEETKEGALNAFERVLNESVEGFIGELGDAGANAVFTSDTDDEDAAANIQAFINRLPLNTGISTKGKKNKVAILKNGEDVIFTLDLDASNLNPEQELRNIAKAVSNSFGLKDKAAVASTQRGTVTTGETKKSVTQIMKENPNLTRAEAIKIFKEQTK